MKAVVFLAEGFEEIEALTPVDYLRRAGVETVTASIALSGRAVNGAHGIAVNADMTFDTYCASIGNELPDAVVVPGGMPGAKNIAECVAAVNFLKTMYEEKKLVCAICASPALVLSKTDCLKGIKWCCYPGMEGEAGSFVDMYQKEVPFVHEENVITGKGPGAAEEFSMEIVKTLCGEETYAKIKTASCQR